MGLIKTDNKARMDERANKDKPNKTGPEQERQTRESISKQNQSKAMGRGRRRICWEGWREGNGQFLEKEQRKVKQDVKKRTWAPRDNQHATLLLSSSSKPFHHSTHSPTNSLYLPTPHSAPFNALSHSSESVRGRRLLALSSERKASTSNDFFHSPQSWYPPSVMKSGRTDCAWAGVARRVVAWDEEEVADEEEREDDDGWEVNVGRVWGWEEDEKEDPGRWMLRW
jgi:hypothetical protein